MKSMPVPVRHVILAAIDRSAAHESVLEAALALARPHSEIHLVCALEYVSNLDLLAEKERKPDVEATLVDARAFLERSTGRLREVFGGAVHGHVTGGKAARGILQTAAEVQADAIIVGAHDLKGAKRFLLGSVSEEVAKNACCPVLVVRPKNYAESGSEIEPACEDCLAAQRESGGQTLWCAAHGQSRKHRHVYHAGEMQKFSEGSMFVR